MTNVVNARAKRFFHIYCRRIASGESDLVKQMDDIYHANIVYYLASILPQFEYIMERESELFHVSAYRTSTACGKYLLLVYLVQFIRNRNDRQEMREWIDLHRKPSGPHISSCDVRRTWRDAENSFNYTVTVIETEGIRNAIQLRKDTNWERRHCFANFRAGILSMVDGLQEKQVVSCKVGPVRSDERMKHVLFVHIMVHRTKCRQIASFL